MWFLITNKFFTIIGIVEFIQTPKHLDRPIYMY